MRTIEAIKADMDTTQARFPGLSELDTTSETGIFPLMRSMYALLIQIQEASWEDFRSKQDAKISQARVGDLSWYVNQAKLFQYGDAVAVIDGRIGYPVIDENKRIITQATATEETTGRLTIRIAKRVDGLLVPLLDAELTAAKEYLSKVKFAGVIIDILSLEADQVKLIAVAKIDRQIVGPSGGLLANADRLPVIDAINQYLSSLPENSVISNTALIDAVQNATGVKDFTISQSFTRRPAGAFAPYTNEILAVAGHGVLHADSIINYTY